MIGPLNNESDWSISQSSFFKFLLPQERSVVSLYLLIQIHTSLVSELIQRLVVFPVLAVSELDVLSKLNYELQCHLDTHQQSH